MPTYATGEDHSSRGKDIQRVDRKGFEDENVFPNVPDCQFTVFLSLSLPVSFARSLEVASPS